MIWSNGGEIFGVIVWDLCWVDKGVEIDEVGLEYSIRGGGSCWIGVLFLMGGMLLLWIRVWVGESFCVVMVGIGCFFIGVILIMIFV